MGFDEDSLTYEVRNAAASYLFDGGALKQYVLKDSTYLMHKLHEKSPESATERRDGATGGTWGVGAPQNSLSPPSALEFLKISVHCRHFRNLLVMFVESVVAF